MVEVKKIFGLIALAGLLLIFAPAQRSQALSLSSPGLAAALNQDAAAKATSEVRWRRYHYRRYYGFRRHYYRHFRHYGYRYHWRHRYYGFF